jgi:hypothetical protein
VLLDEARGRLDARVVSAMFAAIDVHVGRPSQPAPRKFLLA